MKFPNDLKYTKSHEWAKKDNGIVTVGITEYAQKEISDVVFVELPKKSQGVEQGKPACVVESVKAAFDIYAPVSGTVVNVNDQLESDPALVNRDPYGIGWFFSLQIKDESQWNSLLTADQYESFLKQEAK
jgi:glycine cleavage system H protein